MMIGTVEREVTMRANILMSKRDRSRRGMTKRGMASRYNSMEVIGTLRT